MRDTFTLIFYLCKTFIQRWMTVVLFFYLLCSDITEMIEQKKSYSLDYPFTHARTRTHTDACIHARAHILTHINARTHAHTLTRTHTRTHTHTHTHTRARARTHTHTHFDSLLNAPLMTAVLSPRKRFLFVLSFVFCYSCFFFFRLTRIAFTNSFVYDLRILFLFYWLDVSFFNCFGYHIQYFIETLYEP